MTKQKHSSKDPPPLFKLVSRDDNLRTTNVREEDIHDISSPVTRLPTKLPVNAILTNIEEDNMSIKSPQADLIKWNYLLGQYLFTRNRLLATLVILPRKLLKVNPPKCAGRIYGAMTKCPWRNKSANIRGSIQGASAPGDFLSVDQMESSTTVFIA